MHILNERPPNYNELKEAFGFSDRQTIYFTYGNVIYNPHGKSITPDLIRHEETHGEQQGYDPIVAKLWWQRYVVDKDWRMEQEGEAYGAQYAFICQQSRDRNLRARHLHEFAKAMCGPLYGNAMGYSDAIVRIREYAELGRPRS